MLRFLALVFVILAIPPVSVMLTPGNPFLRIYAFLIALTIFRLGLSLYRHGTYPRITTNERK